VPLPIQSGSTTERLRKFFRIRGKVGLTLDEVIAPVVMVQDLTKGPYQSGVTPAAGQVQWQSATGVVAGSVCLLLNDKAGSLTPVLGRQFDDRSFSVTFIEMQNTTPPLALYDDLGLRLVKRADVLALGVPIDSGQFTSIQENDGTLGVPVEFFVFTTIPAGKTFWRGILGDNTNTLGSRRTIDPEPNVTIGPDDALVLFQNTPLLTNAGNVKVHMRGFYQEQPA